MGEDVVRRASSAMFNNDKFVEVVLTLDRLGGTPTTTELARSIGISNDLVMKVLKRLIELGFVKGLPRTGGVRGPLPYEVQQGPPWRALAVLCETLAADNKFDNKYSGTDSNRPQ